MRSRIPAPFAMGHEFVVLSLSHVMCGLRVDASDFLVDVLAHYGLEWFHLAPNSFAVLSIFAHLCEGYIRVPPTVEVFAHFYQPKEQSKNTTLGRVYFSLRSTKGIKGRYPTYHSPISRRPWAAWFYAKLPQSCRLTFKGAGTPKKMASWTDELLLSPEQKQKQQVRAIEELANRGLTALDIARNYLKCRISPLRRRTYLACKYAGPADPTRDSDQDLSVEDIRSKLNYILDLKKYPKLPPNTHFVPTSLVGASTNEPANGPLGSLRGAKKTAVEMKAPQRRFTRSSAGLSKTMVSLSPEIQSSPITTDSLLHKTEEIKSDELWESSPIATGSPLHNTEEINSEELWESSPIATDSPLHNTEEINSEELWESSPMATDSPLHNTEEINSEELWEKMQKMQTKHMDMYEMQEEKRVMGNKCLEQTLHYREQELAMLRTMNESTQGVLGQTSTELVVLKRVVAQLNTEKEEVKLLVSRYQDHLTRISGFDPITGLPEF